MKMLGYVSLETLTCQSSLAYRSWLLKWIPVLIYCFWVWHSAGLYSVTFLGSSTLVVVNVTDFILFFYFSTFFYLKRSHTVNITKILKNWETIKQIPLCHNSNCLFFLSYLLCLIKYFLIFIFCICFLYFIFNHLFQYLVLYRHDMHLILQGIEIIGNFYSVKFWTFSKW